MAILSFNGRANIAVKIVTEKYPQARLYEIQGTCTKGTTSNSNEIDKLIGIFCNFEEEYFTSHITIASKDFSLFNDPVVVDGPWLQDVVIDWPIKMDLPEAVQLKEAAGFKEPFKFVTLRTPLFYIQYNPFFIFSHQGKDRIRNVFVDTVTKKVTVQQ